LSTGSAEGQAFAHFPQSMHGSGFRRIFKPCRLVIKSRIPTADIDEIAQTKNPSKKYFNPRNGRSIQRGRLKFRPNTFFPARYRYSEKVPIEQSQLQNVFRNTSDIERNVSSKNAP
jgi:hypothetical protein